MYGNQDQPKLSDGMQRIDQMRKVGPPRKKGDLSKTSKNRISRPRNKLFMVSYAMVQQLLQIPDQ
jgi:hypothetical protein